MYSNFLTSTSATVWDGNSFSDIFETSSGVPQGCILSPILFALYIDDVCKILPGGAVFSDQTVKVLLYADDLVLLAENPFSLQLQINKLQEYCKIWGLRINTQKTKVLIFEKRQRRRLPEEVWHLNNERIDIVSEFKYLGVLLSSNLNWSKHAKEKNREAKLALNLMWPTFFSNQNIDLSSKYRVFNATVNTCLCYGVQAFGYVQLEEFETIQRHFFKRLFRLPNATPTYAIQVESGIAPIFIRNLKYHSDYLIKIMQRDGGLHKSILLWLLRTNASPFKEWIQLAAAHHVRFSLSVNNIGEWKYIYLPM